MLTWHLYQLDNFSPRQLFNMLKLRVDVFVVEQTCPYPDLDEKDLRDDVYHLIGEMDGEVVACARLMAPGVNYANVSIGRVATKSSARGQGLGHQLVKQALEQCQTLWPDQTIDIGAQEYLCDFYRGHGFSAISEQYLEDGIPHIDMRIEK